MRGYTECAREYTTIRELYKRILKIVKLYRFDLVVRGEFRVGGQWGKLPPTAITFFIQIYQMVFFSIK